MKNIIHKIFENGTTDLSYSEQRVVRLINTICLITFTVTVLATIATLVFAEFKLKILLNGIYSSVCFFIPLYLNYKKKHIWSKWMLVFIFNQVIFTIFNTTPYSLGSWIVFVCLFPLYSALFSNIKTLIGVSLISILLVSGYIYLQHSPSHQPTVTYTDAQILTKQIVFFITTSLGVLFLSSFIKMNLIDHKARLEEALNEKEVLLKEVNHRVKNNLQVISSLFNFQERKLEKKQISAKEIINAAQGRIQSIASVHEFLYRNSNLNSIVLEDYFKNLVNHISSIYYPLSEKVIIHIEGDKSSLELDKIFPIGLIVNEAITNSFKYAFIDTSAPEIHIKFKLENNQFKLEILDNGVGLSKNETQSKGIGLQLIEDMVSQLGGKHSTINTVGFGHKISFDSRAKK